FSRNYPYPPRVGGAHAERPGGDPLHALVQTPGARLELQPPVVDVQLAGARLLALQLGEQLARLVLGSNEPDRAGDENREEEEVQFRHRASGSIRMLGWPRGAAVRSATLSVALRALGLFLVSCAEALAPRPTS